jgi:predicted nucleic acid-binding Zn ribbon protein
MTTYLYETIPATASEPVKLYELQQGMKDAPLTQHPETHEPIRRVILGGWGTMKGAAKLPSTAGDCGCGPSGCC